MRKVHWKRNELRLLKSYGGVFIALKSENVALIAGIWHYLTLIGFMMMHQWLQVHDTYQKKALYIIYKKYTSSYISQTHQFLDRLSCFQGCKRRKQRQLWKIWKNRRVPHIIPCHHQCHVPQEWHVRMKGSQERCVEGRYIPLLFRYIWIF